MGIIRRHVIDYFVLLMYERAEWFNWGVGLILSNL